MKNGIGSRVCANRQKTDGFDPAAFPKRMRIPANQGSGCSELLK
jgi:hypothetical protein